MNSAMGVSTLSSYAYTLGATGNRTAVTELSGRAVNYTYDDLYRLTNEAIANDPHGVNGSVSYGYDPVGNRLNRSSSLAGMPSQSSTYDANDRLNSDTYDNNGNTTAANAATYEYDFENRLVLSTQNSGLSTFTYDGDGNRVSKTSNGVTTNYLVDTNNPTGYAQVVEELQGGAVTKQFTYGHDLISQRCSPLTANCSLSFYGYDGHGSVRILTDATAAVTDTYDYDAFGNLISRTGITSNDYLYSGEQFDANLGFYYLRARYMNPSSGRFFTTDSFEGSSEDPGSLHKYLYANANPINGVDPSGHESSLAELNVTLAISEILAAEASLTLTGVEASVVVATEEVGALALLDSQLIIEVAEFASAIALSLGVGIAVLSTTTFERKPEERQQRVLFGQKRASRMFSSEEDVPDHISGRTISSVAADLRAGNLSSDDIAILAFKDPRSGQLVSANTRGLAALSKAGMEPTNVITILPSPQLLNRLNENGGRNLLGDPMPSTRIPITPTKNVHEILEVITIPE